MIDDRARADTRASVARVYEDAGVATEYLDKRLRYAWQRLLHSRQRACLQRLIDERSPVRVLELAPGPARLAAELTGVRSATMLENSAAMARIARERLSAQGLASTWTVLEGDAFQADRFLDREPVDLAFTFRFIRHFRSDERHRLYAQLHRALMPGGLLVFDVVNRVIRARIDGDARPSSPDELAVYDATYSSAELKVEMKDHGFETLRLVPVIRHFGLQSRLSHKLVRASAPVPDALVRFLEVIPSNQPLEWVAVCCKAG